jgi:deoxyribose-phosphate aldolase
MYIDYIINDTDTTDNDIKDRIQYIISNNITINSITISYYLFKALKTLINQIHNKPDISILIDYPLGISDPKSRQFMVNQAVKTGASALDVCIPQNLAANRKYDKIREDINNIGMICLENNITPRYILEYRFFDHNCLKKICEIFDDFGIKYCFPSTGYFLDNLADNIIASVFLHQNSKDLKVICSGNIWSDQHFETINKSGLFGFRTNSLPSLSNFIKYNYSIKKT